MPLWRNHGRRAQKMTAKQREIITRLIGLLEGYAWVKQTDECIEAAKYIDYIAKALIQLLEEDADV
jgi:hypothetical protein